MLGQEELVTKLESYSINTLPHSIMLIGEKGCGKHTLVQELSKHFNMDFEDITTTLTLDKITNIYLNPLPCFYLIDTTQINERQQNVMLKFLEEPLNNAYIILLCENRHSLLGTILNRCVIFEFKPYTKEQLSTFVKDQDNKDYILSICKTPGQVISINGRTLAKANSICDSIINKLSSKSMSLAGALTVVDFINFKDEYDKPDVNTFVNMLSDKLIEKYSKYKSNDAKHLYNILNCYINKLKDSRLNKVYLFESMIIDMWSMERKD